MKIGIFDPLFAQQPLEEMLDFVAGAGCTAVEIGTGRYPGAPHIDVDGLLGDDGKVRDYKSIFASRGLEISALSCHGTPARRKQSAAMRSSARLCNWHRNLNCKRSSASLVAPATRRARNTRTG